MKTFGMLLLTIISLPVVSIVTLFRSDNTIGVKIGLFFVLLLVLGTLWIGGYRESTAIASYMLFRYGLTDTLKKVDVRGDSMLPTIENYSKIDLHNPYKYGLSRGDIVSFNNIETGSLNYVKRIIGLPGEEISIQNGYVTIDGKILEEPYTLNQTPTYGNTFILDCELYKVPEGSFVVLGDNRTVSSDSRVLGFVKRTDINGVIKTNTTTTFMSSVSQQKILKKSISSETFLSSLNQMREKKKIFPLALGSKLNSIAKKRAEIVRDTLGEKKSRQSAEEFLDTEGYAYTLIHEYITYGYLSEQDILNQVSEDIFENDWFLSPKVYEVGIGTAEKTSGQCAFPVISIMLSWPLTPTYDPQVITTWEQEVEASNAMIAKLKTLLGFPGYDQQTIRSLISKVSEANEIAARVLGKIMANEWLNDKDNADVVRYPELIKEAVDIVQNATGDAEQLPQPQTQLPTSGSGNASQDVPAAAAASSSKLSNAGQKQIEPNAAATINNANESGNTIAIRITFANTSGSSVTVAPVRTQMRSSSHGTAATPSILSVTLGAQEIRSFNFSFEKIPNPPYTFYYVNSSGESVVLGTYTP